MMEMIAASRADRVHHMQGVEVGTEISFNTPFDYMFPMLARDPDKLIKRDEQTVEALEALGRAMFENVPATDDIFDSRTPAIFTYLGQFIDHDLTARTDRDGAITKLEPPSDIEPISPDTIVASLKNGRRPQLDLDSVYADGPGLIANEFGQLNQSVAEDFGIFERGTLRLAIVDRGPKAVDLPRNDAGAALIADMRNDENVIISQLHAAFLAFHNKLVDKLRGTPQQRYIRGRQLTRWAYQYVVIHEYLPTICAPQIVADVLANGPRYFGPAAGDVGIYMPLEFSVAAFRFGHTMIRPKYRLNEDTELTIDKLFFPAQDFEGRPALLNADKQLDDSALIEWDRFAPGGQRVQMARKFDFLLSRGLDNLRFEETAEAALKQLPVRNLLRGFSLSIPTGQAIAKAMGVEPLPDFLVGAEDTEALRVALASHDFKTRTPLWFYILREASIHGKGQHLGAVGSRLVAETMIGLAKADPNSFLNNRHDTAVTEQGIQCADVLVDSISDMLTAANLL